MQGGLAGFLSGIASGSGAGSGGAGASMAGGTENWPGLASVFGDAEWDTGRCRRSFLLVSRPLERRLGGDADLVLQRLSFRTERSRSLGRLDDVRVATRGIRSTWVRSCAKSLLRAPSSLRFSSGSGSSSKTSHSRATDVTGVATCLFVPLCKRRNAADAPNDRSTSLETSRWKPTFGTPRRARTTPKSGSESVEPASNSSPA